MRQAPFYPNIIASDQSINGLQVTMPMVNMSDAAPATLLRECAECRHHHLESLFLDRYYFHIHAITGLPAKVTMQPLTRTVFR